VGWRVGTGGAGLAAIAVVLVLLSSGCGYGGVATAGDHPDLQNGQTLFVSSCGSCHSLQAAGTSGTVGPDLDNAFAAARMEGFALSSIQNVVLDQIRLGSGPIATYTSPEKGVTGLTSQTPMPKNVVTGQNAIDVSAYVASVAGAGGFTTAACGPSLGTDGLGIFKSCGCAGCHTLSAAGSKGTVGPNLDQLGKALTIAVVAKQVTNGGGPMPAFKGKLTPAQIQAVAKYVSSAAGG
jgi:mono/diheme cytochrome c family protein